MAKKTRSNQSWKRKERNFSLKLDLAMSAVLIFLGIIFPACSMYQCSVAELPQDIVGIILILPIILITVTMILYESEE